MSYRDDEEFKEDDMEDEDEDALLGADLDPLDDDLAISDDIEDDEPIEGFAGLDGTEY